MNRGLLIRFLMASLAISSAGCAGRYQREDPANAPGYLTEFVDREFPRTAIAELRHYVPRNPHATDYERWRATVVRDGVVVAELYAALGQVRAAPR